MIVVDFSNVVWACWFASQSAGIDFIECLERKIHDIKAAFPQHGNDVWYCKDQRAAAKFTIWPLYKSNRPEHPIDPRPRAEEWLKSHGARFVWSANEEADDVMATMVAKNQGSEPIVVVTTDKDLWQLLQHSNVYVYQHIAGEIITIADIHKAFGDPNPAHIHLIKTLWGDPGDAVPNAMPRMQKQLMPIVMAGNGEFYDFWGAVARTASSLTPRCRQLLETNLAQLRINWILTALKRHCELVFDNVVI